MASRIVLLSASVLLVAGCMPSQKVTIPTDNPLSQAMPGPVMPTPPMKLPASPATEQNTKRVETVLTTILQANPELGVKPKILVIGSPDPEIFHRDTSMIWVTDGLVQRCTDDAQLTAILSLELGKMVSQHSILLAIGNRRPERGPPPYTPMDRQVNNSFGNVDMTRAAELGRYDEAKRAALSAPPPTPPDPQGLARLYLIKAGGKAEDLTAIAPILREANSHTTWEKQMSGAVGPERPWAPQ
jgi:hypothetical protein